MATLFGDRVKLLSDWIEANPAAKAKFNAGVGMGRTVLEYAGEYAYIEDILERLSKEVGAPRTVTYPDLNS